MAAPDAIELQPVTSDHSSQQATQRNSRTTAQQHAYPRLSPARSIAIYITVAGVTFVCSMTQGCLATSTPDIASKLNIPPGIILWPAAIYSLTSGCTFILAGAIADVVGSRVVFLFGCMFLALTILACGFARDAVELIIFRGLQGVAASCCLPTAISLLSQSFAPGRARTRGLAFVIASYLLGYAAGLFLAGVFVDTVGWRWTWYLMTVITIVVLLAGIWALPLAIVRREHIVTRLIKDIDWLGAFLISGCLGLISYVLAAIASNIQGIKQPVNIALLVLGIILGPVAYLWMYRQEKADKVSLIPTSLWSNRHFNTVCVMLFLASVTSNSLEFFASLYFQNVQDLSALDASLRFLPEIIIGIANSFGTDAILHRISTYRFVMVLCSLSIFTPLFMGVMNPDWSYWYMAFWAMSLLQTAVAPLFIVGGIISTDSFSEQRQALAGSIFNTVYQFGSAVGIGVMAVASSVVTEDSSTTNKMAPQALLEGYRATFWACLGASVLYCAIGGFGLKGIGKVGLKTE